MAQGVRVVGAVTTTIGVVIVSEVGALYATLCASVEECVPQSAILLVL